MGKNLLLSLHIVAVISWMAGILYLYRLLVYHAAEKEPVVRARFEVMERRLYRAITMPAMIAAIVAGIGMIALDPRYYRGAHWLHVKLTLVVGLIAATVYAGREVKRAARGEALGAERRYRVLNEVPTLLMIGIVLLVILKPF
jgi:protoporphyrinogen IX oxidase